MSSRTTQTLTDPAERPHSSPASLYPPSNSMLLGQTIGGRYQIIRHLGGGGFGQTFVASDQHLPGQPHCVVKRLQPRMTDRKSMRSARRLFDTEAEVLYDLGTHDQIPRLLAHFEEDQNFYLVQELVVGHILGDELIPDQSLGESQVMGLVEDVLETLSFVHQRRVIHRDIKPSNLIRRDADQKIVLIDFGAVKQLGGQVLEADGQVSITVAVGSLGYMPNEQFAGQPCFSSDVYTVGMLALQALTGVDPKRLKKDPRTTEVVWRDLAKVGPDFANILDKMVRYDFRQRYLSATEALAALKQLTTPTHATVILPERAERPDSDGHLAWIERANELFQEQRFQEAVACYDKVLQANPEDYMVWFKRGIALENLQQYTEAVTSYDQVLKVRPEDYLAWFKRGKALEELERYDEALEAYSEVVKLQPHNYWAWHDQGQVLEKLQKYEEASEVYDRAVQLKPDFQLAVESRKRVLRQLKQVDQLYQLQHYEEAIASCDNLIQNNPEDALSWLMRGMALENLGQYAAAAVSYDKVVRIQSDDHLAWFKRGAVLVKLNRYDQALVSYNQVVRIQPSNYWAWHERGKLLEHLGRFEEAMVSFDRAVQLKSDFKAAVDSRKRMLERIHSSKAQKSKASKHQAEPGQTEQTADPETPQSEVRSSPAQASDADELQPPSPPTFVQANDAADDYDSWIRKVQDLEKSGQYEEAVTAYRRAMQLKSQTED